MSYQYPAEKGQRPQVERMELEQIVMTEKMDYFTEDQRQVLLLLSNRFSLSLI